MSKGQFWVMTHRQDVLPYQVQIMVGVDVEMLILPYGLHWGNFVPLEAIWQCLETSQWSHLAERSAPTLRVEARNTGQKYWPETLQCPGRPHSR